MTANDRIEKIAEFVKDRLKEIAENNNGTNQSYEYRWQHILRVCNYGKVLAESENANVELVIAGCLLHDIAVFDPGEPTDHGRLGADICRPFLETLEYTSAEIENICYSVASHVDITNPTTLEARIVTDADNIDRFGAFRAFQWVLGNLSTYETLIPKLIERINILKTYRDQQLLETPTGNALFNEQIDFQISFFDGIVKESDWTLLPKI